MLLAWWLYRMVLWLQKIGSSPHPPSHRSRLLSASFECKRPNYHLAVFATLLKLVMGLPQNNRKEKKFRALSCKVEFQNITAEISGKSISKSVE
jgi:hypothetical protein